MTPPAPGLSGVRVLEFHLLRRPLRAAAPALPMPEHRRRTEGRVRPALCRQPIWPTVSALARTRTLIAYAQGELAPGRDPRCVLCRPSPGGPPRGRFRSLDGQGARTPWCGRSVGGTLRCDAARPGRAPSHDTAGACRGAAGAAFAASGSVGAGLASYARLALERVAELATASGPCTVLLAHYWQVGVWELLVALQNAAGRPADPRTARGFSSPWRIPRPRPLWMDVVDRATGWVVLDGLFLKELKSGACEQASCRVPWPWPGGACRWDCSADSWWLREGESSERGSGAVPDLNAAREPYSLHERLTRRAMFR